MDNDRFSRLGQSILDIASAVDCVKEANPPCACSLEEFGRLYSSVAQDAILHGFHGPYVVADPLHPTFFNRSGFWKSVSYMGFPQ